MCQENLAYIGRGGRAEYKYKLAAAAAAAVVYYHRGICQKPENRY